MDEPIYLDYNGTTPIIHEVTEAMTPFLTMHFGNPSSSHWYGIEPVRSLMKSRAKVAGLIGCKEEEIIFTGGGTESNNHAIRGVFPETGAAGRHIITSSTEHPSVLEVCRFLERTGAEVTYLPVDSSGFIDPADVEKAVKKETVLISIMHANNETGTIQPVKEISAIAKSHGILMHTDAAQSAGKIKVDVNELGVDMLSLAGHKIYAPKGTGALYIKQGVKINNLMYGASQEGGMRPGTENIAGISALGTACEIAARDLAENIHTMQATRDLLKTLLENKIKKMKINTPANALPNTLSVSFYSKNAADILEEIGIDVAASAGAACHSNSVELSHVLKAMGVDEDPGAGTLRFSTGRMTTEDEIRKAAEVICNAIV